MRQATCLRLSLLVAVLLAGCLSTPTSVTRRAPTTAKKASPAATPKVSPTPAPRRAAPPSVFASKAPAVLAPSLPPSPAPSLPPTLRTRYTADQPDDFQGYQIHMVYALPQDAPDEMLDRNGAIAKAVEAMNAWLARTGDGATLRFDTHQGDLDVTFVRLRDTDAALIGRGGDGVMETIKGAMAEAGLIKPGKVVMVFYGADGVADTDRHIGKAHQGFGVTFMKASKNNMSLKGTVTGGSLEAVMLHETVHAIGMNRSESTAHVFDTPDDLMATVATYKPNVLLDLNRDNYFAHGKAGEFDLSRSLLLKQPPADARPPKGWPYAVAPAADGIDPMAKAALPSVSGDEALATALAQGLNEARTKAGGTALTATASIQTIARITADEAARGVTAKTINLGPRAGHWGAFASFTLASAAPNEPTAAIVTGVVEQVLASSAWRTQLMDTGATELAVGAVRLDEKLTVTVAIGKASVDIRKLRLGTTPQGVYTFSGEARALKTLDYPLLYTESGTTWSPFSVPLGTDWVPFIADVPRDKTSHVVTLKNGDQKVARNLSISWTFDGTKPPADSMTLPSTIYPVLSTPGTLFPVPRPTTFE
ncbi:hypothetical protein D3C72_718510 [compost metagenome]